MKFFEKRKKIKLKFQDLILNIKILVGQHFINFLCIYL